jgi:branched-chain amino acid transport system substrate-binding protein
MAHLECDFLAPSMVGDVLRFGLSVQKIGASSLTLAVLARAGDEVRVRATLVVVQASLDTRRACPSRRSSGRSSRSSFASGSRFTQSHVSKRRSHAEAVVGLAVALAITLASIPASAQLKIGVIASSTGATAVIGIPQKNTAALLPKKIGDLNVEYFVFDDASDATQTVIIVKRLLSEHKIDALIGPSGSPNAVSVVPLMAEAGTPMLAPVGADGHRVADGRQEAMGIQDHAERPAHLRGARRPHGESGVKTVGVIGFNDPYGDNWYAVFTAQAQKAGIKVVANEKFLRTDASVTGQVAKLMAAKPDAVLVAAGRRSHGAAARDAGRRGYKGRIYQTHGAATPDFLRLGGAKVEGTVLAASLMLVLPEMSDSLPAKAVALEYINAYEKMYGSKPATFGANVYDAGLLLVRAVPEAAKRGKRARRNFAPHSATRSSRRASSSERRASTTCRPRIIPASTNGPGADHRQGRKLASAAGLTLARSDALPAGSPRVSRPRGGPGAGTRRVPARGKRASRRYHAGRGGLRARALRHASRGARRRWRCAGEDAGRGTVDRRGPASLARARCGVARLDARRRLGTRSDDVRPSARDRRRARGCGWRRRGAGHARGPVATRGDPARAPRVGR